MGVVEVWREPNGFWRWRYVEPSPTGEEPVELYSNEVYEFSEHAGKAAREAYPGVPVLLLDRTPDTPTDQQRGGGRPRVRRRILALLGAMVALLVLRLRRRRHAG